MESDSINNFKRSIVFEEEEEEEEEEDVEDVEDEAKLGVVVVAAVVKYRARANWRAVEVQVRNMFG